MNEQRAEVLRRWAEERERRAANHRIGDPVPLADDECPTCGEHMTTEEGNRFGICSICASEEDECHLEDDSPSAETWHSDPGLVYDRRFGDDCPY